MHGPPTCKWGGTMSAIQIDNPETVVVAVGGAPISLAIAPPLGLGAPITGIVLTDLPDDGAVQYWNGSGWTTASIGQDLTSDQLASLRYVPSGAGGLASQLTY